MAFDPITAIADAASSAFNFAGNVVDDSFYTEQEKTSDQLAQSQVDALNQQTQASLAISNNNVALEAERQKTYVLVAVVFSAAVIVVATVFALK